MRRIAWECLLTKQDKLLTEAKERYKRCDEFYLGTYRRGREDVAFTYGRQWDDADVARRRADGVPCLTENRMLPFVHQVVNNIRQTRPAVQVSPVDDKADPDIANVIQGIIRNIENQSNADTAYDTASFNAVTSGFGWLRVNIEYVPGTFDQELKILRIIDPFSVYLDPESVEMDGSDAKYAFAFTRENKKAFKKKFPKADATNFDRDDDCFHDEHTITVAEYFHKETKTYTLALTEQGAMPKEEAEALGLEIIEEREEEKPIIRWCKMTANDILEESEWVGEYIPIVPVYGEEAWIDGKRELYSLIHQAKDPQRRYNYMLSAETQVIALQPKSPFTGDPEQIKGFEHVYEAAMKQSVAFLPARRFIEGPNGAIVDAGPLQRMSPPQASSAFPHQVMFAADGIKASMGIFDASLGAKGNETSGRAIMARAAEGDNATFHFVDNLATSIRQLGRILVDLIPKVYSNRTMARIMGEDQVAELVPINQPAVMKGKKLVPNDYGKMIALDAGRYDVSVSMGASYATKRQETVAAMTEILRAAPEIMKVGSDIIVKNMDWPGAEELAERLKATLPPEIAGDDDVDPRVKVLQGQLQQAMMALEQMQGELQSKQADLELKARDQQLSAVDSQRQAEMDAAKLQLDMMKLQLEAKKLELEQNRMIIEANKAQEEPMEMPEMEEPEEDANVLRARADSVEMKRQMKMAEKEQEALREQQEQAFEVAKTQALMDQLTSINQGIQALTMSIAAPKVVKRNKQTGLIEGVEIGDMNGR